MLLVGGWLRLPGDCSSSRLTALLLVRLLGVLLFIEARSMGRAVQWSPMKPESWSGWFPLKSSPTCFYRWLHCALQNVPRELLVTGIPNMWEDSMGGFHKVLFISWRIVGFGINSPRRCGEQKERHEGSQQDRAARTTTMSSSSWRCRNYDGCMERFAILLLRGLTPEYKPMSLALEKSGVELTTHYIKMKRLQEGVARYWPYTLMTSRFFQTMRNIWQKCRKSTEYNTPLAQ
jgi:hypothetical protein